ncbi:penicillin-binding protein activator LpoB [Parathalassolituus penaei]|uniref:Penicillin-binding protein activator LpoB n=1 Tax=Parathalassolituus penaei TaxID=2997323 RepID=A0A9X3ED21_9GAMM|nr:penicillin-binding protein activator LpoB [Parathalassolituus penaei]MCY0964931.1 penicillin-binding protein activator LpoB [Parathalassolituus penaei]
MKIATKRLLPALGLACLLPLGLLAGCSATEVTRVGADEEIALSDRWNATDSRLVAEEMITDMLSFPWASEFEMDHSRKPTVIIQSITNKSHEHIAIDTFINDIKRSVIRSGKADFVASGDERLDIREERREQELNSRDPVAQGQEKAADFVMTGTINSIVDQVDKKRVTFYQVDLKLVDMTSNIEVWNGQKKIQKVQDKASFGL